MDGVEARVVGIPDFRAALQSLRADLRKRALLEALRAGARIISKDAKANTPVLSASNAIKFPNRTPGLVKKRISVRTSKNARQAGDVGVFVNVRPAKRGQQGAKSKEDPFYWRWLEFGKRGFRPVGFLTNASKKLPEALAAFNTKILASIKKFEDRK